jgi:23S rRNA (uridine2552-2'-O)-methyltransferase
MTRRSTRGWLVRHRKDPYVRKARQEGFRTRASFKLAEIDRHERLVPTSGLVLDLGAAPGGWSQYVRRHMTGRGRLVAIDRLPLSPLSGVETLVADLEDTAGVTGQLEALGLERGSAALVLSDMAPNLTGDRVVDQAHMLMLGQAALALARIWLGARGALLMKFFQGPECALMRERLEEAFVRVKILKPGASRAASAELYLLARDPRLV